MPGPAKCRKEIVVPLVEDDEVGLVTIEFRLEPDEVVEHPVAGNTGVDYFYAPNRVSLAEPNGQALGPGPALAADGYIEGRGAAGTA